MTKVLEFQLQHQSDDPESEKEKLPFTDPSAQSILPPCGPPLAGSAVYEPQHPALEITTGLTCQSPLAVGEE